MAHHALTIGSLFSGIGGLELGLETAGLGRVIWQVEIDPFCRSVLKRHWPEARRFEDVRVVGKHILERVELLCGGFPCQDLSSAGKRAGLDGARSGLWREFLRIARELRPTWLVIENVASGATRWVDVVRRELAESGYATLPVPIAASDCGAPHRRARVFIIANAHGQSSDLSPTSRARVSGAPAGVVGVGPGFERQQMEECGERTRLAAHAGWTAESSVLPVVYGVSGGLVRRRRRAELRALGNTCVPAQAEVIGRIIREFIEASAGRRT